MKRRSFLKGAAALFAAIAGTGPKLLEDGEIIRGGSRLGKTYIGRNWDIKWKASDCSRCADFGFDPFYPEYPHDLAPLCPRGCRAAKKAWRAQKSLRIANHVIETALETTHMLADGAHPAAVATFARIQKNEADAILAELPPWIRRRSVMMAHPEIT